MVKVTGGATKVGAVAAHLGYISRKGELVIETDEGDRMATRDAQKALLKDWHLGALCWPIPSPKGRTHHCQEDEASPQHRSLDADPHTSR
jgi:hypothetical protein